MTFIELGNPEFLPETSYINFEKRRKVSSVIREIQEYQKVGYYFYEIPALQDFFIYLNSQNSNQLILSEEQLYERSLLAEPREEEDSDLDEDGMD